MLISNSAAAMEGPMFLSAFTLPLPLIYQCQQSNACLCDWQKIVGLGFFGDGCYSAGSVNKFDHSFQCWSRGGEGFWKEGCRSMSSNYIWISLWDVLDPFLAMVF